MASVLACPLRRPTAAQHHREDLTYVPVDGLPDSVPGLVRLRETETVRRFAATLAEAQPPRP